MPPKGSDDALPETPEDPVEKVCVLLPNDDGFDLDAPEALVLIDDELTNEEELEPANRKPDEELDALPNPERLFEENPNGVDCVENPLPKSLGEPLWKPLEGNPELTGAEERVPLAGVPIEKVPNASIEALPTQMVT